MESLLRNDTDEPAGDAGVRSLLLAKAVEYEIIPRLMLAHRFQHECSPEAAAVVEAVSPSDVLEFARLILHADDAALHGSITAHRARGIPVQALLLDLLAPVARHLGELWERDLCDFTEVTVGLGRLQQVLRENSGELAPAHGADGRPERPVPGHSILLLPCPGEQHTFGLSLVAEFFHRDGWDVSTNFVPTEHAPARQVRDTWFDVIGFSLGGEVNLKRLSDAMQEVRKASLNPRVSIIAGGAIFALHPEYAVQINADAIITEGSQAPELAAKLIAKSGYRA
ncbi:MAG: cobalamin B12-binding domain-containing protein [Pseudomonadota bacterium]